ncbi:MAG: XdhC family protein [Ectothiorhodospiraceae bacterium]|nr:XdhC family protein [Chromatiales bacterium]MCP5156999.1 XdhC family protein [Ectothiorhodospiraceae bacterium]
MKLETLDALLAARAAKRAVALVTALDGHSEWVVEPGAPPSGLPADLLEAVRQALASDRSGVVEHDGRDWFVQAHNPPLRMLIVGAVHITQALAPMAAMAGYEVTVIDPRRGFAAAERFPGVRVDGDWPDEALERLVPDARTAVVTLTHDPKLDDPALHVALRSEAFYIGCLGSRRTHAARLDRLRNAGFDDADCARLHGPAGLDLGARSPAEIAVSVLAETVRALRRPEG